MRDGPNMREINDNMREALGGDAFHTPRLKGTVASALGKPKSANPYAQGSDEHIEWQRGYREESHSLTDLS